MRGHAAGDRVTQSDYGDGTIQSVSDTYTRILFDAHGLRTFVTSRVVLTRATTEAPPKAAARRKRAPKKTA